MKKINNYLKNKCIVFFMLFVVSLIILLVCSKNSPLYSFNDWVDAHAFFTMGKGIFNGKIPYKDLFEQKGPLLYLIYGIGYLISHDTFIGIFILECVSYTIFSYFLYLISKNYLENIIDKLRLHLYNSVERWCALCQKKTKPKESDLFAWRRIERIRLSIWYHCWETALIHLSTSTAMQMSKKSLLPLKAASKKPEKNSQKAMPLNPQSLH